MQYLEPERNPDATKGSGFSRAMTHSEEFEVSVAKVCYAPLPFVRPNKKPI